MNTLRCLMLVALIFGPIAAEAEPEAKTSFERLKALAGTWEGNLTTTPKTPQMDGVKMTVTLRVTSMGNVLMHEMVGEGRPDDPITMIYLDGGNLQLTHFCDAGNRPRMAGTTSADGKNVHFEFLDVTGGMEHGHMHGALFTLIDENRHAEEWTYMLPGGKSVRARVELRRVK
jgi:hypothetical protein